MNGRRIASGRIPYVPVTVRLDSGQTMDADALVDTGYTGFVVVPVGTFSQETAPTHLVALELADGSPVRAHAYQGALIVGRTRLRPVLITELGDETIIGLGVLQYFTLTLDHAREIALEP